MGSTELNNEFIQNQRELNIAISKINKAATIKECFHYEKDKCVLPIKSAHSLQRQGSLKILEHEVKGNKFLYCHTEREINKEFNFLDLKPIGRKSASTFYGFCDFHDTNIFAPIENEPECTDIFNDEHCFLHSYRSFAHSYHRKYEEWKLYNTEEKATKELLLKMYRASDLEMMKKGVAMALNDFKIPKSKLDTLIKNKNYTGLEYFVIEYEYTAPIACSALTTPHHSFTGKELNMSVDPNFISSNILTTVLPFSDRTIIILAAFEDDPNGILFLDEIDNIKHELIQQKFLSFHLINHAENCYLSPLFYDKKDIYWKQTYCSSLNHIANNHTPIFTFTKKFPINYFAENNAINN